MIRCFRCRNPLQNARCHFYYCHVKPKLGRHCRRLQPDIASPDDHHTPPGHKFRPHRIHVAQAAHGINAAQITPNRRRQTARNRPGGQRQMVIVQRVAANRHGFRHCINRPDLLAQPQRDIMAFIKLCRPQIQPFFRHLAHQIGLGKRRALIRGCIFFAYQCNRPGVACTAQLCHQSRPSLPGPDHNNLAHVPFPLVDHRAAAYIPVTKKRNA